MSQAARAALLSAAAVTLASAGLAQVATAPVRSPVSAPVGTPVAAPVRAPVPAPVPVVPGLIAPAPDVPAAARTVPRSVATNPAPPSGADDTLRGRFGTLSVSPQLAWDEATGAFLRTRLGLDLQTETRVQALTLSAGGDLDYRPDDDEASGLTSPSARLAYRRDEPNARLTADLRYAESDVEDIFTDEVTEVLILDQGTLRFYSASLGFAYGIEGGPWTADLSLSTSRRDYSDTTSPDLFDSSTVAGAASVSALLNPSIRARLRAARSEVDGEGANATDSRVTSFGGGFDLRIDNRTDATIDIVQTETWRREDGVVEEVDGIDVRTGITRATPTGSVSAELASVSGTEGRRNSATLGWSTQQKNYALSLTGGLSALAGGDPETVFSLGYQRELLRDAPLSVTASRRATSSLDGDEVIATSVSASYSQPLGPLSSLDASVGYSASDVVAGDAEEAERLNASLAIRRTLTRDWGVVGGVSHTRTRSDDATDNDDETEVFFGLDRAFGLRF